MSQTHDESDDDLFVCDDCFEIAVMRVGSLDCFKCGKPATLYTRKVTTPPKHQLENSDALGVSPQ